MLDVVIIGGGIAGLWLLDTLRRRGYKVLLIEQDALGAGQTIASQGILHSGLKHMLTGRSDSYIGTLADMPAVWKNCLDGIREPGLKSVQLRSTHCLCWRSSGILSALSLFGARLALRSKVTRIAPEERPAPLVDCPGDILRIEEQVIDPSSLLDTLALRNIALIRQGTVEHVSVSGPGHVRELTVSDGERIASLKAKHVVLTAGAGNADLRKACGLSGERMQRLPLPILVVEGDLPTLNGFCLDGTKARAIITTQRINARRAIWQVGCERANDVPLERFREFAMKELKASLPGFRWPTISTRMYCVDRAEPSNDSGGRANDVFAAREGNVITAWPTKLVLAPHLTTRILELLPEPCNDTGEPPLPDWRRRPPIAKFPWL